MNQGLCFWWGSFSENVVSTRRSLGAVPMVLAATRVGTWALVPIPGALTRLVVLTLHARSSLTAARQLPEQMLALLVSKSLHRCIPVADVWKEPWISVLLSFKAKVVFCWRACLLAVGEDGNVAGPRHVQGVGDLQDGPSGILRVSSGRKK